MNAGTLPTGTPLQCAFLTVLTERPLVGKQMRAELAENGVHKTEAAFFRVMQRLKQESLGGRRRRPSSPSAHSRRLALLGIVTNGNTTTYDAGAALGAAGACQNGIDSKHCALDRKLRFEKQRLLLVDSRRLDVDPKHRFLKIEASTRRLEPSSRRFDAPSRQLDTTHSEKRRFKSPSRSFKSTGPSDRSAVCSVPSTCDLQLQTKTNNEPSRRLVSDCGCDQSQPCTRARQTTAGPHLPTCCNSSRGGDHGSIPDEGR